MLAELCSFAQRKPGFAHMGATTGGTAPGRGHAATIAKAESAIEALCRHDLKNQTPVAQAFLQMLQMVRYDFFGETNCHGNVTKACRGMTLQIVEKLLAKSGGSWCRG